MTEEKATEKPQPASGLHYVAAILLGAVTGYVNVRVEDLLLTALMVSVFAMVLSFLRPWRPWRWALMVSAMIPLGEVVASKVMGQKLTRAGISEAILAALPANACAYGGAAIRNAVTELWRKG